jgi:hypothetical protein
VMRVKRSNDVWKRNKLLRSGKPLKRRTWMRRRRTTRRRSGRVHDAAFLADVHTLPCLLQDVPDHECDGPVQADHAGKRPFGRKADDDTSIPLCPTGHHQRQTYSGWCAGLDKHGMRLVLVTAIAETRVRLGRAA